MNRLLILALLLAAPLVMGAGLTTKVTLNARGQGEVFMVTDVSLEEANRLSGLADPRLKDLFLVRQMVASPLELSDLLTRHGFSGVAVSQYTKESLQTRATARISDVRPLLMNGEALSFSEKPGHFFELNGWIGGVAAGQDIDLTPLKDIHVTLRIELPGAIRGETDSAGTVSHVGDTVTYRWTADRLLAGATRVHVRIVPDIEGTPFFWMALILVVTGLVVLGAFIVLRHGREAGLSAGK